jgi:hypothetical protein
MWYVHFFVMQLGFLVPSISIFHIFLRFKLHNFQPTITLQYIFFVRQKVILT